MVDNFDKIKKLLEFNSDDDFYHCQIIKRKKEHPELGSNSYIVKTYYIKSPEDLDYYRDEMILLATHHNARVQINLNKRSFEKIAFHTQKKIADQLMNKDYRSVRKAYNSCCGKYSNETTDKKWILDIDNINRKQNELILFIEKECKPEGNKYITVIPTKNGYHLITKPFDVSKFSKQFPGISIHKNNPTILYIP